jgi:hypothetical protein
VWCTRLACRRRRGRAEEGCRRAGEAWAAEMASRRWRGLLRRTRPPGWMRSPSGSFAGKRDTYQRVELAGGGRELAGDERRREAAVHWRDDTRRSTERRVERRRGYGCDCGRGATGTSGDEPAKQWSGGRRPEGRREAARRWRRRAWAQARARRRGDGGAEQREVEERRSGVRRRSALRPRKGRS